MTDGETEAQGYRAATEPWANLKRTAPAFTRASGGGEQRLSGSLPPHCGTARSLPLRLRPGAALSRSIVHPCPLREAREHAGVARPAPRPARLPSAPWRPAGCTARGRGGAGRAWSAESDSRVRPCPETPIHGAGAHSGRRADGKPVRSAAQEGSAPSSAPHGVGGGWGLRWVVGWSKPGKGSRRLLAAYPGRSVGRSGHRGRHLPAAACAVHARSRDRSLQLPGEARGGRSRR